MPPLKEPRLIEHQNEISSDEEIDEDEAFNSEDELTYGEFFLKKKGGDVHDGSSDSSDDNDSSSSEEESHKDWTDDSDQEDDGGQYMLDLLENLDKHNDDKQTSNKGKLQFTTPTTSESPYGTTTTEKLTMDSLMDGITNTSGFTETQRTIRALSSQSTTSTPAPRIVSERTSRKVAYEETTNDISQWKDAVHSQRDAETLDFRPNTGGAKKSGLTSGALVDKFEAKTEFEQELAKALEMAGMEDEKSLEKRERRRLVDGEEEDGEDDDLGRNRISVEEYKKRHGELAKMRALLFYEEQKRHRINKIKSKKYRKIQKRKREREKEAEVEGGLLDDSDQNHEKIEKEEFARMKERMTLAHKNTSKWARRVLRRGAKMDPDERRALSLQIAKGEELRKKMMGEASAGEESGSEEEESEEMLLKKARDILLEKSDVTEESLGKRKGLFELDFMKRGMEAQRNRAKEEARRLLEELEANEAAMSSDSENSEEEDVPVKKKSAKPKVASEEETNKVLPDGRLVATSLEFGKSDAFGVVSTDNADTTDQDGEKNAADNNNDDAATSKKKKNKGKKKRKSHDANDEADSSHVQAGEDENPWLAATKNETMNDSKPQTNARKKSKSSSNVKVDIDAAAAMLVDAPSKKNQEKELDENAESEPTSKNSDTGLASLSQAELVKRAFASPDDLEAEKEFQEEKERMKQRDDPTRQKKEEKTVSGWGSWAGAGAPPPRKPRKLPKHLSAPTKTTIKPPKRKDDGMSSVIINEKRLKKIAQFQMAEIPYPYRSRQEYEKAIAGNLGHEWNTVNGVKEMTRPSVVVRAGKVIKPISKKVKAKRAPAKF